MACKKLEFTISLISSTPRILDHASDAWPTNRSSTAADRLFLHSNSTLSILISVKLLSTPRQCIQSTRKQMQMPCKQLFMMARTPKETESLPYAVSPKRSRPAPDRENSQQNQACNPPIREKHFLAKRLQSAKVRNDSSISCSFRRAGVARTPPSLASCTRAPRACDQAHSGRHGRQ